MRLLLVVSAPPFELCEIPVSTTGAAKQLFSCIVASVFSTGQMKGIKGSGHSIDVQVAKTPHAEKIVLNV